MALRTDLAVATAFLTRLPATACGDMARLASAARFFPLVGAGLGLASGGAAALTLALGFEVWLAAVLAVAVQVVLTGALHEDGLADTADGLGGGRDRAARLAIMRDSAVGSYAVVTLVLIMTARIGAVASLDGPEETVLALAAGGAVSRAAMVAVMYGLPPVRGDGLARAAGKPSRAALVQSAVIALLCAAPLGAAGAALIAGAALGAGVVARLAQRRLGGATGDIFGAAQVTAETAGLCALSAVM